MNTVGLQAYPVNPTRKSAIPARRIIYVFVIWSISLLASHAEQPLDHQTEELIEQLPKISKIGYGYSAMFSGSQFLPDTNSAQVGTLVLGSQAPANSPVLEAIVERGILAVPALLKHLDDARETQIPPLSAIQWMEARDEYDYNHRTRKIPPTGVNLSSQIDTLGNFIQARQTHTLTVGDLCFVALGQIMNRRFNATRYQPTGGIIVSSPTDSTQLCAVARADFHDLTGKKHRELLVRDFAMPDDEDRRIGAYQRLAFYYPDIVEPLVLGQLKVPAYDTFKTYDFVRDKLYPEKSGARRKSMFDAFTRNNGPAFSDGILLQLFEDLDMQESNDEHRLSPPLTEHYDARNLLIQLYGFGTQVKSADKPFIKTWENGATARFIEALWQDKDPEVNEAIKNILLNANDDDYVAVACMNHLMHRGYDQEIRNYCERRIPKSEYYTNQLREIQTELYARKLTNAPPTVPAN